MLRRFVVAGLLQCGLISSSFGVPLGEEHSNTIGIDFRRLPESNVLVSVFELSNGAMLQFAEQSGYEWKPVEGSSATDPAGGVSRIDASLFASWLTEREQSSGDLTARQRYRLPSPAEWKQALGGDGGNEGGVSKTYLWGNDWPPPTGTGNLESTMVDGFDDPFAGLAPQGKFSPSPVGIHDLIGNLWEWVQPASNEFAPSVGVQQGELMGGSFVYYRRGSLRLNYRYRVPSDVRIKTVGARLVLDDLEVPIRLAEDMGTGQDHPLDDDFVADQEEIEARLRALTSSGAGGLGDPGAEPIPPSAGQPFLNSVGLRFSPVAALGGLYVGITEVPAAPVELYFTDRKQEWRLRPTFCRRGDQPACGIGLIEARDFCDWLTTKEREGGWIGKGDSYRLLADHEWSLLAGLPPEDMNQGIVGRHLADGDIFPWGIDWPPPVDSGNFASDAIDGYFENTAYTASVSERRQGAAMVQGLAGNVSEWVDDLWEDTGDAVARGGSFATSDRESLLSSFRRRVPNGEAQRDIGFRIALELGEEAADE